MATASLPAASSPNEDYQGLWNGRKIPYIRVSGAVNSGKSLFSLLIDENVKNPAAPQTTVVWDLEGSTEPYEDQLNFERRDLLAMVRQRVNGGAYKPIDVYTAWVEDLIALPQGKYKVGIVDPFTDVETGLVEWVRANPGKFGRTSSQYSSASSMFLWPDIKAWSKQLLMSQLRPRFETFVTCHHLKAKWEGQRKTNDTVAEGLDVLEKLASLHIELDRTPPAKGAKAPRLPRGEVKKQRIIFVGGFGPGGASDELLPVLPPVIPDCTPNKIRWYIDNPADYDNLKPEEQALDHSMTADQRLQMQAGIAEAQRDTAQAQLAAGQAVVGMPTAPQPIVSPVTFEQAANAVLSKEPAAAIVDPANFYAPQQTEATQQTQPAQPTKPLLIGFEQLTELKSLWKQSGYPPADFIRQFIEPHGTQDPSQLTETQAESVIAALREKIAGPTPHDHAREWAARYSATREAMLAENGGNVTRAQIERLQQLFQRLNITPQDMARVAAEYKVESFMHLTMDQADEILCKLLAIELGITQQQTQQEGGQTQQAPAQAA